MRKVKVTIDQSSGYNLEQLRLQFTKAKVTIEKSSGYNFEKLRLQLCSIKVTISAKENLLEHHAKI